MSYLHLNASHKTINNDINGDESQMVFANFKLTTDKDDWSIGKFIKEVTSVSIGSTKISFKLPFFSSLSSSTCINPELK